MTVASTYIATRRRDRIVKAAGHRWLPPTALRLAAYWALIFIILDRL